MFRFSLPEQEETSKRGDCAIKFFLLRLEMLEWVAETKLLLLQTRWILMQYITDIKNS
jgi:hypothetical protein